MASLTATTWAYSEWWREILRKEERAYNRGKKKKRVLVKDLRGPSAGSRPQNGGNSNFTVNGTSVGSQARPRRPASAHARAVAARPNEIKQRPASAGSSRASSAGGSCRLSSGSRQSHSGRDNRYTKDVQRNISATKRAASPKHKVKKNGWSVEPVSLELSGGNDKGYLYPTIVRPQFDEKPLMKYLKERKVIEVPKPAIKSSKSRTNSWFPDSAGINLWPTSYENQTSMVREDAEMNSPRGVDKTYFRRRNPIIEYQELCARQGIKA